jgi:SAM-dependent methyltransferase
VNGQALAGRDGFRAGLSRSARLLLAFRTEQSDPSGFYTLVAADAVAQLGQYTDLRGKTVIDVGGGPGFFSRALCAAGARACCLDTSLDELAAHGAPGPGAVAGSALRLPVAAGSVDVCFSANVLEHVGDWRAMLAEMVRVTRPGGVIFVSYTNWLSPWGGHETSPWHYLGGYPAAERYGRRYGHPPKNRYGAGLYPVSVAAGLRWATGRADADLVDARPRYLPAYARRLLRVPGLREIATWNLWLVLRRR